VQASLVVMHLAGARRRLRFQVELLSRLITRGFWGRWRLEQTRELLTAKDAKNCRKVREEIRIGARAGLSGGDALADARRRHEVSS
jgi:hypothetical protein